MSDKPASPLDSFRKGQEEEYFRKQNADLAAKIKARAEMQASGVSDAQLADQLVTAGFDKDSVRALDFIPIIEVAWADGKLQAEERMAITKILDARGIMKETSAYKLVSKWLSEKPTDEIYFRGKSLVEPLLADSKKTDGADWVLKAAERVAAVTGGVFGIIGAKISAEEKKILEDLAKKLR